MRVPRGSGGRNWPDLLTAAEHGKSPGHSTSPGFRQGSRMLMIPVMIHSKREMSGSSTFNQRRPMMMKKTVGFQLHQRVLEFGGGKPMRIFDPSRGGIGIKLKAASMMLIWAR